MSEPEPCIVHAVIVVHDRYDRLAIAITSLRAQTRPPDRIWVVDNTALDRRKDIPSVPTLARLTLDRNLGGAGGYALGVLSALGAGATHLLLLDDDGVLAHDDYIAVALAEQRSHRLDILAPVAIDETDSSRLCFPVKVHGVRSYAWADAEAQGLVFGPAHLFNGTFAPAQTFIRHGIPDLRLFIRGDEVDFLHRVLKAKGRVATSPRLRVTHPSAASEAKAIFGRWLMAIDPGTDIKRELTYRNRGYIFVTHRLYGTLMLDAVRYCCYFLIARRGDVRGLLNWFRLTWRGARSLLGPPQSE
jgi:rhamnopyranosyl-N-acetylglucosaminyl-diphospho-decaprenol beta-1,3/1,4-galactofuranosyltransferase